MMPKTLYILNVTMSLDIIDFKMLKPAPTVKKRDHLFSKIFFDNKIIEKINLSQLFHKQPKQLFQIHLLISILPLRHIVW